MLTANHLLVALGLLFLSSAMPIIEDCSSCAASEADQDQQVDPLSNASVTLTISPVNDGECEFDDSPGVEGCLESEPCKFSYTQVVNVGLGLSESVWMLLTQQVLVS